MTTIYDPRYIKLIEQLLYIRKYGKVTQVQLAEHMGQEQSFVSKVENFERRLDIIELYDWLLALKYNPEKFFCEIGWFADRSTDNRGLPALPIPREVEKSENGSLIHLAWQGTVIKLFIEKMSVQEYIYLEKEISKLYSQLNNSNVLKNRDVIYQAMKLAFETCPKVNPSDIYHHIIYRLYLREYSKTQADRSWVRAGGEALELFIVDKYSKELNIYGIGVVGLVKTTDKVAALTEMGLNDLVGGSKLDIALYGFIDGEKHIFGGIHLKASLAERVTDDVPCSEAMIRNGYVSYLLTMDAKSYPPPNGDLVNRGELGSVENPSDKRNYIEGHGSFTGCYSYNLRTISSGNVTRSGSKIYSSTFEPAKDSLPAHIISAWNAFAKKKLGREI